MKVIVPVEFQESQLLATNAVETTPDYAAGTTYAKGAEVHYLTRVYESLENSNTGNQPDISPTKWLDIGPDNISAMFDNEVQTSTVSSTPLTVSIKPGKAINSLALLNLYATSVTIQVLDEEGGNEVYNKTIDLNYTVINGWYSYFFEPFDLLDTAVVTDIPPYKNCVINLSITAGAGSNVSVGSCIYGSFNYLGDVQYGVSFGIRDYSVKETDEFGNTTFVKRAYSKRMEPSIVVPNGQLRTVTNKLNEIRATPTVWIGTDFEDYQPLVMYGFYRDYNIDVSYPTSSLLRLEIEGLV
jgi:hypothetical protein